MDKIVSVASWMVNAKLVMMQHRICPRALCVNGTNGTQKRVHTSQELKDRCSEACVICSAIKGWGKWLCKMSACIALKHKQFNIEETTSSGPFDACPILLTVIPVLNTGRHLPLTWDTERQKTYCLTLTSLWKNGSRYNSLCSSVVNVRSLMLAQAPHYVLLQQPKGS